MNKPLLLFPEEKRLPLSLESAKLRLECKSRRTICTESKTQNGKTKKTENRKSSGCGQYRMIYRCRNKLIKKQKPPLRQMAFVFYKINLFLIFIFIKKKIFLCGIIRPDVFNGFINITFIFQFLQIFYYFNRCAGTDRIINQFIFCSRPGCVFKVRG